MLDARSDRIAGELVDVGWSVCADFLPPTQIAALADELSARWTQGEFHQAGVSSGANPHQRQDIRNDHVYWLDDDGGQMRLYLEVNAAEKYIDVLPRGGTLACFLSDRFYHEVLPATRERLSVTGWFRARIENVMRQQGARRLLFHDIEERDYIGVGLGITHQGEGVPIAGHLRVLEAEVVAGS